MPTILYTSLAEIKSFNPCASGWKDILKGQGKTEADDTLFPLIDCLNSNSISDVFWLLGKRKTEIDIAVKFARKCADSVKHLNSVSADMAATYADRAANAAAAIAVNYAALAVNYTAYTAYDAATAATAYHTQQELNKQFLIECIKEWEESH